ncbi:heat shock protein 70 [Tanacetum coccineum]
MDSSGVPRAEPIEISKMLTLTLLDQVPSKSGVQRPKLLYSRTRQSDLKDYGKDRGLRSTKTAGKDRSKASAYDDNTYSHRTLPDLVKSSIDNILLGEFELSNLPLAPKGVTKVKVSFDIDANGIFQVSAQELTTGLANNITITTNNGFFTEEETEKMLQDVDTYNGEHQKFKKNVDTYNSLKSYISVIRTKMKDANIRKRLSWEDLKHMEDVIEMVMQWLDANKQAETKVTAEVMKEVKQHCARKYAPIRSSMGIGAGLREHLALIERPDKIPVGDQGGFEALFTNRVWEWRVVAPPQTRPIAIPMSD